MDVEFTNEQQYRTTSNSGGSMQSRSTLVRKLLENGIVSTESAGTIMIIAGAILIIALGVFILLAGKRNVEVTYIEDLSPDVRAHIPPDILETYPSRLENVK